MIMNRLGDWEKLREKKRCGSYGPQWCWMKVVPEEEEPKQSQEEKPKVDYSAFFEDVDDDDPFSSLPL